MKRTMGRGVPSPKEEESPAGLVLPEITEYLGQSGLVDSEDLRESQLRLNTSARSIARQVESHFGM
ncbi:hypothetical protein ACWDBD_41370 [Streptomyces sp. NPDC001118]